MGIKLSEVIYVSYSDDGEEFHRPLKNLDKRSQERIDRNSNIYLREALLESIALCERYFEDDINHPVMKTLVYPEPKIFSISMRHKNFFINEEVVRAFRTNIKINESVPRTILFLSRTRKYLSDSIYKKLPIFSPFPPPSDILDEIFKMYEAWDSGQYLDISNIDSVFVLHQSSSQKKTVYDESLLATLTLILSHEYGHDIAINEKWTRTEELVKKISGIYAETFKFKYMADTWMIEHLADIYGFELFLTKGIFKLDKLIYALSLSMLISLLTENYFIVGSHNEINPHPSTMVRPFILAKILIDEKKLFADYDENIETLFLLEKLDMFVKDVMKHFETESRNYLLNQRGLKQ